MDGILAVSRAIGDLSLKQEEKSRLQARDYEHLALTPVPYISEVFLQPEDEFIVIGCDGLFDVLTNEQVVAWVRAQLNITKSDDYVYNSWWKSSLMNQ